MVTPLDFTLGPWKKKACHSRELSSLLFTVLIHISLAQRHHSLDGYYSYRTSGAAQAPWSGYLTQRDPRAIQGQLIRPLPCRTSAGGQGVCMFVWDCSKRGGTALGICTDRFMFGGCCQLPSTPAPPPPPPPPPTPAPADPGGWTSLLQPGAEAMPTPDSTAPSDVSTPWPRPTRPTRAPRPPSVTPEMAAETEPPAAETEPPAAVVSASSNATAKRPECGVPPLFPLGDGSGPLARIVGGRSAPFGSFPWQLSVRRTSFFGLSTTHRCGGALLNEQWAATAAHCVDDLLLAQIRIRVGEYDFGSLNEPHPYQERSALKKVVHPKYNFYSFEHDLALVKLDKPVELAPNVYPICLPGNDDLMVGDNATITGWGRLSEGGIQPGILQQATVPILENDKCKNMFKKAGRVEFIPDIFLCAGYEKGGIDACQGDSGGPLQVKGKDGRWFLAGIISWGIGCAEPNLPGVSTRISKFTDWILEQVAEADA